MIDGTLMRQRELTIKAGGSYFINQPSRIGQTQADGKLDIQSAGVKTIKWLKVSIDPRVRCIKVARARSSRSVRSKSFVTFNFTESLIPVRI